MRGRQLAGVGMTEAPSGGETPRRLDELERRLERMESTDAIRQLAAKYSLALDMRDIDALANLFADDVRVGKDQRGRPALKRWLDETMRVQFTGTAHHIGGHIIEFDDERNAHGVVYSKNEHETGPEWVIMQMMYWDHYEKRAERWLFRRRWPLYWYASDLNKPPLGDRKMRWPGREPYAGGWHDIWPSWRRFWESPPDGDALPDVAEPAPVGAFLKTMRASAGDSKAPVR